MSCGTVNNNKNTNRYASYPSEEQLHDARDTLKPPGILSNVSINDCLLVYNVTDTVDLIFG